MIIAPSFLSADFLHLEDDVKRFNASNAEWLHYDVMDGNFVPNISFGPVILKQINKITNKPLDVHIMVSNPLKAIDYFDGCTIEYLTFHVEATSDIEETTDVISKIKEKGYKVGISVKPKTDVSVLEPILKDVDLVLIMSVEPGFGGQKFMEEVMWKGDYLNDYRRKHNLHYIIEVDGGINDKTCLVAKEHHFDALVAGSFVFKHPNGFDYAVESLKGNI